MTSSAKSESGPAENRQRSGSDAPSVAEINGFVDRFNWRERSRIHCPGEGVIDRVSADDWISRLRRPDKTVNLPGLTLVPANAPLAALLNAQRQAGSGSPFCIADAAVVTRVAQEFNRRNEFRFSFNGQSGGGAKDSNSSGTPSFVTVSSGTTGFPRLVARTHASWIFSFEHLHALGGTREGDRVGVLGSLGYSIHAYAAFEALHLGADVLLLSGMRPDRQMVALAQMDATVIYATPTQLRLLGQKGNVEPAPAIRRVMIGGAACDRTTLEAVERQFPNAEIYGFYGSSETSFVSMAKLDSGQTGQGQLFPRVEVMIRPAPKTAIEGPQTGEIWVRSPMVFSGYVGPGAKRCPESWFDGYFFTGDVGWLGPGGTLAVVGRSDRIVRVAERSLALDEIEAQLSAAPGVRHVAAVAVPDHLRGSRLTVAVKLESGTSLADVTNYWRGRFDRHLVSSDIRELDPWPSLPSGKTDYEAIRRLFSESGG